MPGIRIFRHGKVPIFLLNLYHGGPYTAQLGAQIYGAVSVVAGMAAIWSIMILSVERAWVVFMVTRNRPARLRCWMVRLVVSLQWLAALALSLPPLVGYSRCVLYSVL